MTIDLDDLTHRLEDQVSDVNGTPDLDDLQSRVGTLHRRRRWATGAVTAAFVLALAAGSVVWSTASDAPAGRVSVADTTPTPAPAATNGPVTRETPYGLLTVEAVPTASYPAYFGSAADACLGGTALKIGLVSPDGSKALWQMGVTWTMLRADPGAEVRLGSIAMSNESGSPTMSTIVNAGPGRYRATFADGTTDESTAVAGSVVFLGPPTTVLAGGPDFTASTQQITVDRLADDGTVVESWDQSDLAPPYAGTSVPPATSDAPETTDIFAASCVTFDSSVPADTAGN